VSATCTLFLFGRGGTNVTSAGTQAKRFAQMLFSRSP
jgi:hypothetical protein